MIPVAAVQTAGDARPPGLSDLSPPLVDVRDLTLRLITRDMDLTLLHGVTFTLQQGDVLCLVGESGSGKTVTLRALMRLLPPAARIGGSSPINARNVTVLPEPGFAENAEYAASLQCERDAVNRVHHGVRCREQDVQVFDRDDW